MYWKLSSWSSFFTLSFSCKSYSSQQRSSITSFCSSHPSVFSFPSFPTSWTIRSRSEHCVECSQCIRYISSCCVLVVSAVVCVLLKTSWTVLLITLGAAWCFSQFYYIRSFRVFFLAFSHFVIFRIGRVLVCTGDSLFTAWVWEY